MQMKGAHCGSVPQALDWDTMSKAAMIYLALASTGGVPQNLTTPDPQRGERFHDAPQILPGDDALLLTIYTSKGKHVALKRLGTEKNRVLVPNGCLARYLPTGHIVYRRQPTNPGVWALPFSLDNLEVTGEPFLVVPDGDLPSVSADGTLILER